MTAMKTKTEARRQHILNTADAVFQEMGFEAASMSEIAVRVGGSKATLYNYFKTKEELFFEIMRAAAQEQGKEAFAIVEQETDFETKMRNFCYMYLQFSTSTQVVNARRMAISQALKSTIGKQIYECGVKIGWTKVSNAISAAMDAGELTQADPWLAAMHIKGLLEAGIADFMLLGVEIDITKPRLKKAADLAMDVFLKAYKA
jgi:AcrR family transcriptional regulator